MAPVGRGVAAILMTLLAACSGSTADLFTSDSTAVDEPETTVAEPAPAAPLAPATTTTTTEPPAPPHLEVSFPAEGGRVSAGRVLFTGRTDPDCTVEVGPTEAAVDAGGNWEVEVALPPGMAVADVVAVDAAGTRTEHAVRVDVGPAPELIGDTITAVWSEPGITQEYYRGGATTGLRAETRQPLGGDRERLGFAEPLGAGAGEPRAVLAMILDTRSPAGDRFRVRDAVAVPMDPQTSIVASVWPVDGSGPYVVRLRYTDGGPRVDRGWLVSDARRRFVEVPPERVPLADLAARTVAADGTGRIVGRAARWYTGGDPPYDPLDLSRAVPVPMNVFEFGGYMVSAEDEVDAALSLLTEPGGRDGEMHRAWYEQMIARDYTGRPIWHVTAVLTLPVTPGAEHPSIGCYTADWGPVAAVVTPGEQEAIPLQAWVLDRRGPRFVEVDPGTVQCPYEGDD